MENLQATPVQRGRCCDGEWEAWGAFNSPVSLGGLLLSPLMGTQRAPGHKVGQNQGLTRQLATEPLE